MTTGQVDTSMGRIHFHPYGLGSEDNGEARVYKLTSIMDRLQHSEIDILKIDIEGAEYDFFNNIFESNQGHLLRRARQLQIEFHYGWGASQDAPDAVHHAIFSKLHELGFVVFEEEPNIQFTDGSCIEYSFLRLAPDFFPSPGSSLADRARDLYRRVVGSLVGDSKPKNQGGQNQPAVSPPQHAPAAKKYADGQDLHSTFQHIYKTQFWGADGKGSGLGSSLQYTAKMRPKLVDVLMWHNITHVYDAPCGGMAWMPSVIEEVEKRSPNFKYTGYDVACNVISRVQGTHMLRRNWDFDCVDVSSRFPVAAGGDLQHSAVFSRDALQHLPYARIQGILQNIKQSGIRWLLVGSYIEAHGQNRDISAGDYFPINLLERPFNLKPDPIEVIDEETPDRKHILMIDVHAMTWDSV